MTMRARKKSHVAEERPPFACIALLLQGGGALGAYQAGVYEALAEARIEPDWVAGISIGAINSALIAGNPPESRIGRLREFWEGITHDHLHLPATTGGDAARNLINQLSASLTMFQGAPGFFRPRPSLPWWSPTGSAAATSFYDTSLLRSTLERLIDFDRINAGTLRFSVGAVNIRTGNFVYFDNTTHHILPEHVLASGALPPGFPSVEIEGEYYWDGGLVSNTPLECVLADGPRRDTLAFQVDLWSARGEVPRSLAEVATRQKEILYSSRTRASTDRFRSEQRARRQLANLLKDVPDDVKQKHEDLVRQADTSVYNIVHLIYRSQTYEGDSKDYEFSRVTMEEHWRRGYLDTVRTLRHPEVLMRPTNPIGLRTFDIVADGLD